MSNICEYLLCPISHELMTDPVTLDDGHTYERSNIEKWLNSDINPERRSPMTRQRIETEVLLNNRAIKRLLDDEISRREVTVRIVPPYLNLFGMLENQQIGINLAKKVDCLQQLSIEFFKEDFEFPLLKHINELSDSTIHWIIGVERTLRDSANYFVDGDSLLLTAASHCNINWNNYGHTIHCIHYAERLLYMLYKKTNKIRNYTIIFFNNHADFLRKSPLLSLLRQCFINHFTKNLLPDTKIVRVFDSWLSNEYIKFLYDQKPLLILYNDMSRLETNRLPIIDKKNLHDIQSLYHLFGIFHSNIFHCSLYLMNNIEYNNSSINCFQVKSKKLFDIRLITIILNYLQEVYRPSDEIEIETSFRSKMTVYNKNLIELCFYDTITNDVRLYHYLLSAIIMGEKVNNLSK